jgi:hypothetical protein
MKNLFLILFLVTTVANAQEYKIEEKALTGVFEVSGKTKSDIFSSVNKWISINYNSSKNVIQLNDPESGTIIVKGINEVVHKDPSKALYPNNKYYPDFTSTKFNHLLEINVKDGKFRIIYRITDIVAKENTLNNEKKFDCISFIGTNEAAINEYLIMLDQSLKDGWVGIEKRESYKELAKSVFYELNDNLIKYMKLTMASIDKTVKSTSNDSW